MTRVQDDFLQNFEQSTVETPADKAQAEGKAKGAGKGSPSVTVDAPPQSPGGSSIPIELVPPPAGDPNLVMAKVQSLQSKLSTNQMSSSSNQMETDQDKMHKAIKDYNNRLKEEQKEQHKAHHKGLVGKIFDDIGKGLEDVAVVAAGVLIAPVCPAAGALVIGCGALMFADQLTTGQFGNKPMITGKGAKIFDDVAMGAAVVATVVTLGAGAAGGAAAVADDTVDAVEAGVDVAKTATQAAVDAGDMTADAADTVVNSAREAAQAAQDAGEDVMQAVTRSIEDSMSDLVDSGDVTQDTADSVNSTAQQEAAKASARIAAQQAAQQAAKADPDAADDGSGDGGGGGGSSSDDIEMDTFKSSESDSMEEMDEQFTKSLEDETVNDPQGGDGSGDGDDSTARMKKGLKVIRRATAVVKAFQGIGDGIVEIGVGKAESKAQQFAADAESDQKDIKVADMDDQQVIDTLKTQVQAFETISQDLTSEIMAYGQTKTDTAVQGYA